MDESLKSTGPNLRAKPRLLAISSAVLNVLEGSPFSSMQSMRLTLTMLGLSGSISTTSSSVNQIMANKPWKSCLHLYVRGL